MQFVIKFFPEINLKSRSIHRRMSQMLRDNVYHVLQRIDPAVQVLCEWDKLMVSSAGGNADESPGNRARYLTALACIPGIEAILEVEVQRFSGQEDILAHTRAVWAEQLAGKTFCVRVRRSGQHGFTSLALQAFVGAGLLASCPSAGVRLREPDILIQLEVVNQTLYLVRTTHPGLGGYPVGTQESVLSLLSGGFDSALASYQFIKRGCRVHYCFFNLGGAEHQRGVQQMASMLWQKYGSSHRVHFIAVDFAPVLGQIVQHVAVGNQGVVLKRMMLRVADRLAQRLNIPALATGEALGQVASQTLSNLQVINLASETVVLRPLVTWDKPDIIAQARHIGVAQLAETIPEYCGAISKNPTIKASLRQVEKDEQLLDAGLVPQALASAVWFDVRDLAAMVAQHGLNPLPTPESTPKSIPGADLAAVGLQPGDVVIDVRPPDEVDAKPLRLKQAASFAMSEVQCIPFYRIASEFEKLDPRKTYFLYCERGVMSRLQALHLQERGFANVRVYRA